MKLALVQSKQGAAYDPENPGDYDLDRCRSLAAEEIDRGFGLIGEACDKGANLIVTIEAFNGTINLNDSRYDFSEVAEAIDGPVVTRFSEMARDRSVYIIGGLYTKRDENIYNSALLFGPDGELLSIFDKVHLPAGEEKVVTPGDSYPVIETDYGRIGMLVCWDLQYPEAAREVALGGADLIACPTWGWEKRYGLCRAYENGLFIGAAMGVPASGEIWDFCDPSCIVDQMGRIVAEGNRTERSVVISEIDITSEPEPQYGSGAVTGWNSMRRIRMSQRKPATYRRLTMDRPPLFARWEGNK